MRRAIAFALARRTRTNASRALAGVEARRCVTSAPNRPQEVRNFRHSVDRADACQRAIDDPNALR